MNAITSRFGARFFVVTLIPNIFLVGYVSFLVAAGAPKRAPSLPRALNSLDHLTAYQAIAGALAVISVSVAIHPLQTSLIQLIEGYWWGLPFGRVLANFATRRFRDERDAVHEYLDDLPGPGNRDWATRNTASRAQLRRDWLPEAEEDLRPTDLGNALWRGETRAGNRYGIDVNIALPRLIPFLPPDVLQELRDRRNQLDASVRLCVMSALVTVVGIGLLIRHGPWLFLAVATYGLSWASYRAAVAAARGFSTVLATAIDLSHLKLYDALCLARPADLEEEISRNKVIMAFLRGAYLSPATKRTIRYMAPPALQQETEKPTATADGSAQGFAGP